jgi:hypothetical protein
MRCSQRRYDWSPRLGVRPVGPLRAAGVGSARHPTPTTALHQAPRRDPSLRTPVAWAGTTLCPALLYALIALSIKLDGGVAVFYSQERVSQGGQRFKSGKFRSMAPAAETGCGPLQAAKSNSRITRGGHWLHVTVLDELP